MSHKGFDVCQLLLECESVFDLDDAIRVVNEFYRIYRPRLEVLEENEKHINFLCRQVKER